jgi:hypothetical protein
MFRGFEKGLKGDPLVFGSPEDDIKGEEESCKLGSNSYLGKTIRTPEPTVC